VGKELVEAALLQFGSPDPAKVDEYGNGSLIVGTRSGNDGNHGTNAPAAVRRNFTGACGNGAAVCALIGASVTGWEVLCGCPH